MQKSYNREMMAKNHTMEMLSKVKDVTIGDYGFSINELRKENYLNSYGYHAFISSIREQGFISDVDLHKKITFQQGRDPSTFVVAIQQDSMELSYDGVDSINASHVDHGEIYSVIAVPFLATVKAGNQTNSFYKVAYVTLSKEIIVGFKIKDDNFNPESTIKDIDSIKD